MQTDLQRKEMFLLFIRVNTLLVEHDTISAALARAGGTDEELSMMQIELQSECSTIEVSFNNEVHWTAKYIAGCVGESSSTSLELSAC
jgi:hypothetical protein